MIKTIIPQRVYRIKKKQATSNRQQEGTKLDHEADEQHDKKDTDENQEKKNNEKNIAQEIEELRRNFVSKSSR
ncbi:hypothetical protein KY284_000459 [Solanum tuberosum]|nr:hypothetical protein KY284_000459 [Solanum tuberosum]